MTIPLFQVDAFTDKPFCGNPAAVCLLSEPREAIWMQQVAREMNLSETAFILKKENGFGLRWFTPAAEVDLCGHATLAAAHVLWEEGIVDVDEPIRFSTLSGWLGAKRSRGCIELDFPAAPLVPFDISEEYIQAVGAVPDFVGRSGEKWLFEYHEEADIRKLEPNFVALKAMSGRGLIVTSLSATSGIDFVSRYFAPWIGINEDPVTGSAHTILGPYWGKKLSKNHMVAYQASARGGLLRVRLSAERVYIGGRAVTVFKGELFS